MIKKHIAAILFVYAIACVSVAADSVFSTERQVNKLADGVYVIRHQDPFRGWVHGNTAVIIGTRDVFVVDSCQMPGAAREDIADIRKWTDKPVRYLLNTHWHTDHNGGNAEYLNAFPGVAIVARAETRERMDDYSGHVANSWVKDATSSRATITQRVAAGKAADGKQLTDAQVTSLNEELNRLTRVFEEAKTFVYQGPTLTFDRELKIDLGGREIEVKYLGKANTAGDALAYLPKEKILITGDIVVHPVPYAFDGYPGEWVQTLHALEQLPADTIVPGHGEVLHDKTYLIQVAGLMKAIIALVDEQLHQNPDVTLDEVKKPIKELGDYKSFRERIAVANPANGGFFDYSMGSRFVELVYHELKQR
jgi:glyoxylase-like metal-dependent hydrolase (beta-lactamase superfamily II)